MNLNFSCVICGEEIILPIMGQHTCHKEKCRKKFHNFIIWAYRNNYKLAKVINNKEDNEQQTPDEISEVGVTFHSLKHIVKTCLQGLQRNHSNENVCN